MKILDGEIDISSLLNAKQQFDSALAEAKSPLEKDGVIQRFEFTFELSWKTMKRILATKGLDINNPKDVIRFSAKNSLIEDPDAWLNILQSRNLTTHVYNKDISDKVYQSMPEFSELLDAFVQRIFVL